MSRVLPSGVQAGAGGRPVGGPRGPRIRRLALATVALGALAGVGRFGANTVLHDRAPRFHTYENRGARAAEPRGTYRSAELCRACHPDQYDAWKASYLSRSWSQAEGEAWLHRLTLDIRGTDPGEVRFCLECHAPLALAGPEDLGVTDPLAREGVTCTVCHGAVDAHADPTPGWIVSAPLDALSGPYPDAVSPFHRTSARSLFQEPGNRLCGACHLSAWPFTGLPIDATWREWDEAAGPADERCVTCHMPARVGRAANLPGVPERVLRSHTFPGGHDPAFLATAVTLSVVSERRVPDGLEVVVDVRNEAGHDLPTGNPPAPEVRLGWCAGSCATDREPALLRSYRASLRMADGRPTYDVTVAAAAGPSTALRPWETRRETVVLPVHAGVGAEIRLDFSYWRPYEPSQRLGSYVGTVRDHLSNPEVDLRHLVPALVRADAWRAILPAIGKSKGEPVSLASVRVGEAQPPGGTGTSSGP